MGEKEVETSPMLSKRTNAQEGTEDIEAKRQSVSHVLSLFWRLALPYWKEEKAARWDLGGVVLLTLLQSGMAVVFSYVGRDFWNALSAKDMDAFSRQTTIFFIATVIGTPIVVFYGYTRDRLALKWREWLTKRTLDEYFGNRNYYNIESSGDVDNPDQRLAEDLRAFTQTSLQFILTLIVSAVDVVAFSTILFSIYPQLFAVLLAYSGCGTIATVYIGKRLIGLNFSQLQKEADFRYSLVRVRENSENIAFYKGERREKQFVKSRLMGALENYRDIISWQRNLEFFTTGYRYIIQVLPALVVAPLYFAGKIELGVVSQSFSAFNHILNDLSIIINRFEQISAFSAGIDRLGEFVEFLESKTQPKQANVYASSDSSSDSDSDSESLQKEAVGPPSPSSIPIDAPDQVITSISATEVLQISGLTLMPPGGSSRVLVQNLDLTMKEGDRLLIVGASGTGKSSLLRAIAGLWSDGSGEISRRPDEDLFFLPQRPYCTLGTLREQLLYPRSDRNQISDAELLEVLDIVDLGKLPERMGGLRANRDWGDILSLGEQQRLAFGRLLVNKPKMVILDEASSALDLDSEALLYRKLTEAEITVCSVGHRPTLLKYHDTLLRLLGDGKWRLEEIEETAKQQVVMQTL